MVGSLWLGVLFFYTFMISMTPHITIERQNQLLDSGSPGSRLTFDRHLVDSVLFLSDNFLIGGVKDNQLGEDIHSL